MSKHIFNYQKNKGRKFPCFPLKQYIEKLKPHNIPKCSADIKREVILDTETTGLYNRDRIIEISIIETIDGIKTGRKLHYFFNPGVRITKKAVNIHRMTNQFLTNFPYFPRFSRNIIDFIGDSYIVAHNAHFDKRMLNNELQRAGWEPYPNSRFIDTLKMARYLFPKEKNNQDALCQRFKINNFNRINTGIHSALEDTIILYFIYNKMIEMLKEKNLNQLNFSLT